MLSTSAFFGRCPILGTLTAHALHAVLLQPGIAAPMPLDFVTNSANEAFNAQYDAKLFHRLLSPSQARCSPPHMSSCTGFNSQHAMQCSFCHRFRNTPCSGSKSSHLTQTLRLSDFNENSMSQGGPVLAAVLECGSNEGGYQWGRSLLGMAVAKADKEQARAIVAACRQASAPAPACLHSRP